MESRRETFYSRRSESFGPGRDLGAWGRGIPLARLIPIIFETMATSKMIPPFQLVLVGRKILTFLEELRKLNEESMKFGNTQEETEMLEIFSNLFSRMVQIEFEPEDGFQEFLDDLWELNEKGIVDFKDTDVPSLLLSQFPLRIDELLLKALDPEEDEREAHLAKLISISCANPENARSTFNSLQSIFEESQYNPSILEFSRNIFIKIRDKMLTEHFLDIFKTEFQPLLVFCLELEQISREHVTIEMILSNELIANQLIMLIDQLFTKFPQDQFLPFLLTLIPTPNLSQFISNRNANKGIRLKEYPVLWKFLNLV